MTERETAIADKMLDRIAANQTEDGLHTVYVSTYRRFLEAVRLRGEIERPARGAFGTIAARRRWGAVRPTTVETEAMVAEACGREPHPEPVIAGLLESRIKDAEQELRGLVKLREVLTTAPISAEDREDIRTVL